MTCLVSSLCKNLLGLEGPFYLKLLQQLSLPSKSWNITRRNKNINSGVNFLGRNHENDTCRKMESLSLSSDTKAALSPYVGYSVRSSCRNLWTPQVQALFHWIHKILWGSSKFPFYCLDQSMLPKVPGRDSYKQTNKHFWAFYCLLKIRKLVE